MFHIAKAILCLYVVARFIIPLPWPRSIEFVTATALMVVFQHSRITLPVSGSMFSPKIPRLAMVAVNWVAGFIHFLVTVQVVADIFSLVLARSVDVG
ncbi:hypothetical protein U0027_24630 (plasmid) [Agrobacterium tumefaciens]|uniref:hypothetical protein n=1 Tax=Agrobacterium tumefaciens TaxID=358 RepID=UPI000E0A114E|nr:hypothetical protein [Agrobacterium tumefaciens]WQE43594.1 hypothetical protein U0027_24630 [Agrobacterium tumefaciens]